MSLPSHFHPLPVFSLCGPTRLLPAAAVATLNDPAAKHMTDLHNGPCVMADHTDGLDETLHVMLRAQVHMALVTGVGGDIIGMVSRDDLQGEKPVQRALADNIHHNELALEHVMAPVETWQVVERGELAHARLGDVVTTLREHGLRYLLVVGDKGPSPSLCGLYSARHLEVVLGSTIPGDLHSRNFAELEATLGR